VPSAVFLERGVEHAFAALTQKARVLSFLTPAGFEGFYREMGAIESEVERLVATAAKYGCEITGPAPRRPPDSGLRLRTEGLQVRREEE
jgi:hypothetical protein